MIRERVKMPDPSLSCENKAARVVAYAIPAHLRADESAWRQGALVVMIRGNAVFPKFCFKCGAPCEKTREVKVHSALAIINRNQTKVSIPLCERHDRIFRMLKRIPWIGFGVAMGIAASAILIQPHHPIASELILDLAYAAIIVALILEQRILGFIVRAKRVDRQFVTLKGAGKEFLEMLPEI
jgi:hypothetical protein